MLKAKLKCYIRTPLAHVPKKNTVLVKYDMNPCFIRTLERVLIIYIRLRT